jgi:hypothetical protein
MNVNFVFVVCFLPLTEHVNSTADTFSYETESILSRTTSMLPGLASSETQILGAFSGLRPSREGGARVFKEMIQVNEMGRRGVLVHNYGAGGTGFQAGYGMAVEAVNTVTEELQTLDERASF